MIRRNRWSPDEDAQLAALTAEGLYARAIGKAIGRSQNAVTARRRALRGVKYHPTPTPTPARKHAPRRRDVSRTTVTTEDIDCRAVWLAVIDRAFIDAKCSDTAHRHAARAWFDRAGRDFRHVCALAGLEPGTVVKRYKEVMATHVMRETVKSWSSGRNPTPAAILDRLAGLAAHIDAAADEAVALGEAGLAGLAADDAEAQSLGWPCVGAHRAVIARAAARAMYRGHTKA
jgi:hypothetical protein